VTDDAVITSFTASAYTITEGGDVRLSWATQDATSCEAIGGTNGWSSTSIVLNGYKDITISTASADPYTFTIECEGQNGPVQKNINVKVNEKSVTPPTPNDCDAPLLDNGKILTWTEFWNADFPGPAYGSENSEIPRRSYLALEFNSGDVSDTGKLETSELTSTSGRRIGSISKCPGDFDVAPECDHVWGNGGGIFWSTTGYSGACDLEPDTTYYFNLTFTNGADASTSECVDTYCLTMVRHRNP